MHLPLSPSTYKYKYKYNFSINNHILATVHNQMWYEGAQEIFFAIFRVYEICFVSQKITNDVKTFLLALVFE